MKIWVDAQLPPTLASWLNSRFEVEALSLKDLGLRDARDIEIFEAARTANAVIMTKDSDFIDLAWIIHERQEKTRKESLKRFRIRLSRVFSISIVP
jgi:predicted nuclease of predicted toxin-antitoxin system